MIIRIGRSSFWIGFLALIFLLSGCGSDDDDGTAGGTGNLDVTKCPSNRPPPPVACTLEFDPVCGFKSDGSSQTYANGCNACADLKVNSYLKGRCP